MVKKILFLILLLIPEIAFGALTTTLPSEVTALAVDHPKRLLANMGYLDVTLYGADPTGATDSTDAIQDCVNDAKNHQLVAFFTHQEDGSRGIYLVSKTIECMMDDDLPYGWGRKANMLFGSFKGGIHPLIRLASGSSGFDSTALPKAVFWFWSKPDTSNRFSDYTGDDEDPLANQSDISFDQTIRGIDIDLNGNAGAIGIKHPGAQGAAIENVAITATGGFAGIGNTAGLGAGVYDVTVTGGRYGIYVNTSDRILVPYAGIKTFIGCKFINQTHAVIKIVTNQASPICFVGCNFQNSNVNIPFNDGYINSSSRGGFVLVDCVADVNGGQFIDTENKSIYIRNSYLRGANSVVSGWTIFSPSVWTWIKEYSVVGGAQGNLIDGVNNSNTVQFFEENASVTEAGLIASLVDFHCWDESAMFDPDGDYYNIKLDGTAVGDGSTDDRAAIIAGIAAADAANKKLFFPKGHYLTSGMITLGASTKMFGCSKTNTMISPYSSWTPTTEAMILSTASNATGTTILSDILIGNDFSSTGGETNFTPIQWRVGENSIMRDVISGLICDWVTPASRELNFHRFRVNGYGGGKWYGVVGRWRNDNNANRGLLIENTNQPMYVYPINFAGEPKDIVVEINTSDNKFFYFPGLEGGDTCFKFINSDNGGVFCSHKNADTDLTTARGQFEIINCTNIAIAMASTIPEDITDENHVYEVNDGHSYTLASANIALFKRGDPEYIDSTSTTPLVGVSISSTGIDDEAAIREGGGDITYTVVNDTLVATAGDDNPITDEIIANLSGSTAFNTYVRPAITHAIVTRTSDTVLTIGPLPAVFDYEISADDPVTGTLPSLSLTGNNAVTGSPIFTIAAIFNPTNSQITVGYGKDLITFGSGNETLTVEAQ